jgi:hypothetical protein
MVYPTLYIYRIFFPYLKISFKKMNYDNQLDKFSNFFENDQIYENNPYNNLEN